MVFACKITYVTFLSRNINQVEKAANKQRASLASQQPETIAMFQNPCDKIVAAFLITLYPWCGTANHSTCCIQYPEHG